tara:strand:+ start:55 stop:792 length:738 start_codon:yes stop_codon:yes gene_type:complete
MDTPLIEQTKDLVPEGIENVEDSFIFDALINGATEVANRVLALKPNELSEFCTTKTVEDELGTSVTGEIISVVRENGTKGNYEPCTPIDPAIRFKVTDSESLFYKSKFNPAFYILERTKELDSGSSLEEGAFPSYPKVYIVPSPSYSEGSVFERGYVTMRKGDVNIDEQTIFPSAFPRRYAYLLPLYAAIKIVEHKLNLLTFEDEDEELTDTIEKAKTAYQKQYDNAFIYMGSKQTVEKDSDDED